MTITTATVYVVLLAAADLAALVLKVIAHQIGYHEVPNNTFLCKGDVFVQVVSCYANWTLVLICFERFLAVCYPLKRNAYFTTKKAIVIAVLLGVTLCLCLLYGFINMDKIDSGHCDYPEYAKTYWYWITAIIYFFLPFILLSIFTGLIIVSLRRQRKAREAISAATQTMTSQARMEQTMCIMMVCAAIVFLILTLPTCIYHLIEPWVNIDEDNVQQRSKNYYAFCV
ncbi:FMRFamide receptor-like [Pomacea canaliculata]|uniref:FMRFamide receptor-like n=1 Tax=Pomacea canaliculata TaxID=400727 RepID=UPI000D73F6C6|nr:FMRFamide receptor-like [Pomacea canaliculata]